MIQYENKVENLKEEINQFEEALGYDKTYIILDGQIKPYQNASGARFAIAKLFNIAGTDTRMARVYYSMVQDLDNNTYDGSVFIANYNFDIIWSDNITLYTESENSYIDIDLSVIGEEAYSKNGIYIGINAGGNAVLLAKQYYKNDIAQCQFMQDKSYRYISNLSVGWKYFNDEENTACYGVEVYFYSVEISIENEIPESVKRLDKLCDSSFCFALASDLHYNPINNDYDGFTEDQRMQYLVDDMLAKHAEREIKFLILCGDITHGYGESDDYQKQFVDKFAIQLPFPIFYLVGNHDAYTQDEWIAYYGHKKQFSFETDDFYIICLDVYHDAEMQHGTTRYYNYVGVDYDFLGSELEKAKTADKKIIVCSHTINTSIDNNFYNIIESYNTVCYICGHSHVPTNSVVNGIFTINAGWFALRDPYYSSNTTPWGYNIIKIEDNNLISTHIIPAHNYTDSGIGNIKRSESKKDIKSIEKFACADYNAYTFRNRIV